MKCISLIVSLFLRRREIFLLSVALMLFLSLDLSAQEKEGSFSVQSFRPLEWDLDARSTKPMRDQNGKKAALIKVITSADDLDFDVGLMGIVAVKREVGETWVYVPEHVRKITIRHKDFGVIRDYVFPEPIESAVTYEMVLKTPPVVEKEIIVRDSIIYMPSPADSAALSKARRKPVGLSVSAVAMFPEYSGGLMVAWEKYRFGAYVKAVSNFMDSGSSYNCLSDGTTAEGYIWTSGRSRVSRLGVTAGLVFRTCPWLSLYAGAGYGDRTLLWEDSSQNWAKVSDRSYRGVSADLGLQLRLWRFRIGAGISTTAFRTADAEVSVGFCF